MTTTDLNEGFRAERLALIQSMKDGRADSVERAKAYNAKIDERIASGKLVPVGGGSYRVVDPGSYDNGEVWTLQKRSEELPALLLPQSGLDESTGKAALYTRYPEWHDLGNVVPEGVSDLSEVLKLGGIDWTVEQRPVKYNVPSLTESGRTVPKLMTAEDFVVNTRSDTNAALGVVGSRIYTPIQNADAASWLVDLADLGGVVFESAGATYGGKHVFIGMRLPEDLEVDLGDGVTDTIRQYLFWRNVHDGTRKADVIVTPWRIACGNTERFALRDATASWGVSHTKNWRDKTAEARRSLGKTVHYFAEFKDEEEQLARNAMEIAEFEALLADIWPVDEDASTRAKNAADTRTGTLTGMFKGEADKFGWTSWAAERAITDWTDHVAPKRAVGDNLAAARATAIVEGGWHDDVKYRAHKQLMLRVDGGTERR